MIATDPDTVAKNLRGYMAVAEVPGDAGKMMGVACGDLRNRFVCCDHAHDASVLELQPIAVMQHRCFREIEQKHGVLRTAHGNAAAMTAVMRKLDAVGFARAVPVTGRQNFSGADHTQLSYVVPAKAGPSHYI